MQNITLQCLANIYARHIFLGYIGELLIISLGGKGNRYCYHYEETCFRRASGDEKRWLHLHGSTNARVRLIGITKYNHNKYITWNSSTFLCRVHQAIKRYMSKDGTFLSEEIYQLHVKILCVSPHNNSYLAFLT